MIDQPPYRIDDTADLLSPSLVVFVDLVRSNLEKMIAMAGGADRLRAHVKTHKMPAIVRISEAMGLHKHKAATIAECEMVAAAGGRDVLLSYPLVGPNVARMRALVDRFPSTTFRATVDDPSAARALSEAMTGASRKLPVMVDLEIGMGRTGIAPGPEALALYELVASLPGLEVDGLHAYDGHIHQPALDERRSAAEPGFARALAFRQELLDRGLPVPRIVAGGTPTFPVHCERQVEGLELSPGTCVLQDHGYGSKHPELPFIPAALLLTRVVSRPRPNRLCFDLGHKAVAADPPGIRAVILGLPDAKVVGHNEEHLVVETPHAAEVALGTPFLAIPEHICPTCALHRWAYVVEGGKVVDRWEVGARDRVLTI